MNTELRSILFLFLFSMTFNSYSQTISFHNTSQSNIERIADTANKPYLIYLYETGNRDCKKMEKYTFTDPQLANVINELLISNKIDVHSEEGGLIKKSYSIELVPTLLFFNKFEELIHQQEVAMGSAHFLKILAMLYKVDIDISASQVYQDRFDNSRDGLVTITTQYEPKPDVHIIGETPKQNDVLLVSTNEVVEKKIISEPEIADKVMVQDSKIIGTKVSKNDIIVESKIVERKPTESKATVPKVIEPKEVVISTPTIIKSDATNVNNTGLKIIQLGAFNKYGDVVDSMIRLQKKVEIPLSIIEENTRGKLMYKLVSGDKLDPNKAAALYQSLKDKGIDCFIRSAK